MNRVKYLMKALEINEVQAELIDGLIKDVPDHMLKDFLIFRMDYIQPHMSKELITKKALFDYRRMMIERQIKANGKYFKTKEELFRYLQKFYRGKDIVNGGGVFYDYVVIGMNNEGELINKYAINEFGNYIKLSSEETSRVLGYLLENQHKIGVIKYISKDEVMKKIQRNSEIKKIEYKDASFTMSEESYNMIKKLVDLKRITND